MPALAVLSKYSTPGFSPSLPPSFPSISYCLEITRPSRVSGHFAGGEVRLDWGRGDKITLIVYKGSWWERRVGGAGGGAEQGEVALDG